MGKLSSKLRRKHLTSLNIFTKIAGRYFEILLFGMVFFGFMAYQQF